MTGSFKPRWEILPPAQRQLWPQLARAPSLGFALYGGTAVALRLGRRTSVDFDFFGDEPLDRAAIVSAFPFMAHATTIQDQRETWVVLAPAGDPTHAPVKISFFGTSTFGRVSDPDFTDDGVLQVASLDDLLATKVKVILQRAEAKDDRDIAEMLRSGVSLSRALGSARLLFGPHFQPSESLKALVYFDDGDLKTLSDADRQVLLDGAKKVHDLPEVTRCSNSLVIPV